MAKNIKKTNSKRDDSSHEERLMVLVENLGDEIKLVAEGNLMLQERMDANFEKVWDKFDSMGNEINSLRNEMHDGFKSMVDYFSRIEDEIAQIKIDFKRLEEKKADKEMMIIFEKRINKIERELAECKNLCKK